MSNLSNELYEFDNFRLDVADRLLFREGERIPLAEKGFETLYAMVKRGNHLVTKGALLNEIWPDAIVEENNLAKNISLLRKALGQQANGGEFIETVRGHGFRFNAEVRRSSRAPAKNGDANSTFSGLRSGDYENVHSVSVEVPQPGKPARPEVVRPAAVPDRPAKKESRFWPFALGLTTIFGLIFLVSYSSQNNVPSAAPITSIAVLPFVNADADPQMAYFSDGVSESLIDRLSALPQLKVIARSSSFKYRGENVDLQDAANKLGVQAIITGRVVRRGDDLSIRAELIDARGNNQLWGADFNRKVTDVLAVQQEITLIVTEKLRLKLFGAERQQTAKQDTVNSQAYELLLKGRFLQIKGGTENLKKALDYYQQAIAIDPNYALGHALVSDCYFYLIGVLDPIEFTPKAKAAARKALELDPNLADGHRAMANLYLNDWNWTAAESEYKRAIEINPNLLMARNNYSAYLSIMGRHDEAIAEARRSRELDPLTLHSHGTVAYTLAHARRYDEAIEECKKIIEVDRNYIGAYGWLGLAYSGKGMSREAADAYLEAFRLGDLSISAKIYLGAAYAKAGEREKALGILKELETSKTYVSPGELPVLYVAMGEREKAFASFEKAYAAHDLQLQFLNVDASFDSLRDDPRFIDLVKRVGLPN